MWPRNGVGGRPTTGPPRSQSTMSSSSANSRRTHRQKESLVHCSCTLTASFIRWSSFLKDVKILVISYCLPRRMFHTWMYRSFNLPSSLQDASPQTQPVELLVTDCLSILYKLCTQLMSRKDTCPKPEEPERIMLVEEETIMYLCRSTTLLSPSDFLKGYAKPVDILMDSGNYQIVVCILIVAQQSVVALKIVFIFRNSVAHSTSTLLVASTEDRSGSHTVLLALV
ncbi:uncharacterized protein LOC108939949 isoform X4 [Scleropages formosus]|uniref:uncharacterized protein LOC108939949 isoform X4 n=1 Tax=Scleropages formosus TaxID=113540 RepID=UPI000878F36A|nr:uncharacterized protein LOC108939949 isoform X4 [Scleropages formosus]